MSNSIENAILDSIELVVDSAISNAGYDRTIQATIKQCVDKTIGKYSVQYQDSTFYAYSNNLESTYADNSLVYVTIPNNDMSKDKVIIGSVKKLGVNYISESIEINSYDKVGVNLLFGKLDYSLYSYKDEEIILYEKDGKNNLIEIDEVSAQEYLKQSGSLICAMKIKTKLPKEQQLKGNYGLRYELIFTDEATGAETIKTYTFDVDKMTGNPYKFVNYSEQTGIYPIEGENFVGIKKIVLFASGFPKQKEVKDSEDIFITNLELYGANRMSDSEINGNSISILTPDGNFFATNANKNVTKRLKAQVKIKGKVADPDIQDLKFYWFKEDVTITSNSLGYSVYGGRGWRCLNSFNQIDENTVEWVPGSEVYTVTLGEAPAKENKYKCVVKSGDATFSKTCVIKNMSPSALDVKIVSDSGNKFTFDIGNPSLTCEISQDEGENKIHYYYTWSYEDNNGSSYVLTNTTDANDNFEKAKKELEDVEAKIEAGTLYGTAAETKLETVEAVYAKANVKDRVKDNQIFNIDLSTITEYRTYKCTVYKYDSNGIPVICGTASLIIYNSTKPEDGYYLGITNGNQIFKYSVSGTSPASPTLENPKVIEALGYYMFDEKGDRIPDEVLNTCKRRWKVPVENTMIKIGSANGEAAAVSPDLQYKYFDNVSNLIYTIEEKFDFSKENNQIELEIDYKGTVLRATTTFNFLKEGESGTAGTDVVCRIIPNVSDGASVDFVTIYRSGSNTTSGTLNFKTDKYYTTINSSSQRTLFKAEVWENGEQVNEGFTVGWSILGNTYGKDPQDSESLLKDTSDLVVTNSGKFTLNSNVGAERIPGNLVKATFTYKNTVYYDVRPVIFVENWDSNYTFEIKQKNGFYSALYTSDGLAPQYNSAPFEIGVIHNTKGDMSLAKGEDGKFLVDYKWGIAGEVNKNSQTNLIIVDSGYETSKLKHNQKLIRPIDVYDGVCVNNTIVVDVEVGGKIVGRIKIPVHLKLNNYGFAALNNWDGNTIQINEDGGYILAPQVGAGSKNKSNQFSGVLMGEVKEAGRSDSDRGLFGYHNGQKSFFVDSDTGATVLGKQGQGRLSIDPSNNEALIYSNTFWKGYNDKGLPSSYKSSNEAKAGMLIDLSTPAIRFGTGKFSVDANGYLFSKSGEIGCWNITDSSLYSDSHSTLDSKNKGVYLAKDGISLGAYDTALASVPFKVTSGGELTSKSGTIGGWTINGTTLKSGNVTLDSSNAKDSNGNEPIKINVNNVFTVNNKGALTAKSGTIANWKIGTNELYSGEHNTMNSQKDGMYLGSSGISLGVYNGTSCPFQVTSSGALTARSGKIGGWTINGTSLKGGSTTLNSGGSITTGNFSVDENGALTSTSGSIGGWTITSNSLESTNSNIFFQNDGTVNNNRANWYITSGGKATFKNIEITGGSIKSASITGSGLTVDGTKGLANYVENLVVDKLKAGKIQVGELLQIKDGDNNGATFYGNVYIKGQGALNLTECYRIFVTNVSGIPIEGVTGTFSKVSKINVKKGLVVGVQYGDNNSEKGYLGRL